MRPPRRPGTPPSLGAWLERPHRTSPGRPYPEGWEADVVLRDGETTHIRPITPDDAPALQAFHVAQSERSTYMRFFAALERLPERDLARFTTVDHVNRVALIAVRTVRAAPAPRARRSRPTRVAAEAGEADEQIIGVARFDRITDDEAEVAFNIADAHQRARAWARCCSSTWPRRRARSGCDGSPPRCCRRTAG